MAQVLTGPTGIDSEGPLRTLAKSKTVATATGGITISPPSRAVRAHVAGTLVVTYADGSTDTLTVAANELLYLQLVAIDATSTATEISVFW